jgi:PTS system mannitol-specific IIC component
VLSPIGVTEAKEAGESILFMLETNPGPGLGVLLAYWVAGPRAVRPTVPGAVIIQFLGGIHEIYFPYVLMKPQMILAAIAGGAAGVLTFLVTGAGLVATPSPGSIFAYLAVTPRGGYFGVLLGVAVAAAVAFVAGVGILRMSKEVPVEDEEPTEVQARTMTAAPQGV